MIPYYWHCFELTEAGTTLAAPTFNPGDGTTTTNAGTNITLTFAEAIKANDEATPADFTATTLKTILTLRETDAAGTEIPYSATISSDKTTVTIDPTSNLADGAVYVAVSGDWYDAEGNQGSAAKATFTVDTAGPAATFNPADGATVTDAGRNVTLTFDEAIKSDTSGTDFDDSTIDAILTLKAGSSTGSNITFDATIDGAKKVVTINPSADLPAGAVYVAVSSGHYDAHGNQGSADSATFTVGSSTPDAPAFNPANGTTTTDAGTDITLTFAAAIKADDAATPTDFTNDTIDDIVTLKKGSSTGDDIGFDATIDGAKKVVTIDPDADLADGMVYVAVSDAWYDGDGVQGSMASATFTVDTTPPAVTFNPDDGDTVTVAGGNVTLTFDEAIKSDDAATPTDFTNDTIDDIVTLKKGSSTGDDIGFDATIDGAKKVVTIDPDADLEDGAVYVAVSSSYWDAHGNRGTAAAATFTVSTASSDATLSALAASSAESETGTFTSLGIGTFSATTTDYEATVAHAVTHAKLTPTAGDSDATLKAGKGTNLTTVTSGMASAALALDVGANALKVEVTAEDASKQTYTVTVKRRFAMPTGVSASGDGKLALAWTAPTGGTLTGYDVHYTSAAESSVANDAAVQTGASPSAANGWVDAAHAGTLAEDELTGLTNGTTYRLRVRATSADVDGEWAFGTGTPKSSDATLSALTGTTSTDGTAFDGTLDIGTFSGTTTAYTAEVAGAVTHVKLTPAVNDSDATVKVGPRGGTLTPVTSGSASAAIALDPGANPIDVEVTAEDESVRTYTVTVTRLSVPSGVTVAPGAGKGGPTISVAFTAPSGWGAVIQIKPASDTGWPVRGIGSIVPSGVSIDDDLSSGDLTGGTSVFKGFQENAAYDVRLHLAHATSGEIIPASTTPVQVTTWTVPGAPTAATAAASSSSALDAGWTAPTETGGTGATVTGYKVRWREKDTAPHAAGDQAGAWSADAGVDADSATAHAISGLESNTAYEVELRALNGIDPGSAWSDAATGMTALPAGVFWSASLRVQATASSLVGCDNGVSGKACSTGTVLTEDGFTVNGRDYAVTRIRYISSGVLTVRLTRGPDTALGALRLCIGTDAGFPLSGQTSELTFSNTNLGWSAGGTVPLRIATSCAAGAPTVPDRPAELAATPDDGRLDLRWRAPAGSVAGYDVHYTASTTAGDDDEASGSDPAAGWVAVSRTESDPPAARQAIAELTNGTAYRVRVRAKNAIGDGDWARQTATPAVPVAPSVPQNVTVTPGDGQLTLAWEAPASWGTWPGKAFTAEWKLSSAGNDAWSYVNEGDEVVAIEPDATGFVFTGTQRHRDDTGHTVANGTAYDLRIRVATQKPGTDGSQGGHFRYSGWVTVTDQTPMAVAAPSVPRNVTVTPGDAKLTLAWEAPASWGTWTPTLYEAQWKLSSAGDDQWLSVNEQGSFASILPAATSFTFTGSQVDGGGNLHDVTNGTAYDLRIRAYAVKPGSDGTDPADGRTSDWVAVTGSEPAADAVPPPAPPGAVWSAMLTVDQWSTALGCSNHNAAADNCSTALTEDQFTYPDGGATYTVTILAFPPGANFLHLEFDRAVPDGRLYLNVGGRQFDSDDAKVIGNSGLTGNVWQWASAGLTWADGQQVTVSLSPSNLPDAPAALSVRPGDGRLDLAWTAPPGPVTGYDVHYTSAAGAGDDDAASGSNPAAGWVAAARTETDPPTASQAIAGLANDTPHRVRVRAVNAHGAGAWARRAATPAAVAPDPLSPAPGAVWSATLTVKNMAGDLGCDETRTGLGDSVHCEPTAALSDDDFSYGGVGAIYDVTRIMWTPPITLGNSLFPSTLSLSLDRTIPDSLNPLQLRIKGYGAYGADMAFPLADGRHNTVHETDDTLVWNADAIPNWQPGARFRLSLERVQPWVSLQKVDRMLRVLWTMPGEGSVSGWDVHYTASSSAGGNAPAGEDPATGWVDTENTGTSGIHEIGGLENGTEYRVRVRARWAAGVGGAEILSPWGFRSGAPEEVLPGRLTPDPNLLTGISFNDGVRDLPVEPNIANAVGFGGPGWYAVHVPPGVRSVTVTPTFTNTNLAVTSQGKNITLDQGIDVSDLSWTIDTSGEGVTMSMGSQGYGSMQLTLVAGDGTRTVKYNFLLSHNNAWKSADDYLKDLDLRAVSGSGAGNGGQNSGQSMRPAVRFVREFRGETETYRAEVPRDVTEVTVDAETSHPAARVTVNGGRPADPVALGEGETDIAVEVTAEDERYRRTYLVTVAREGAEREAAPGSAEPLTATFEEVPDAHDGAAAFWLGLRFSEPLGEAGVAPVPASFDVRQGKVKDVERVEPGLWRVRIRPASWRDVSVTLAGGRDCAEKGAVCAAGGKRLSETAAATIGGPVRIRLEGGTAREGRDATLDFRVTLNRAASGQVSVDYATADGTAKAGEDYAAVSGTLRFAPGETERTVAVPILDDAVDEGREKFYLRLSNPQGAYLRNMHREATGVIRNDDPLQRMWLSRFGRTVAETHVDAVLDRLQAGRSPGFSGSFAGQPLPEAAGADGTRTGPESLVDVHSKSPAPLPAGTVTAARAAPGLPELTEDEALAFRALLADGDGEEPESRAPTEDDVLLGTSFMMTRDAGAGLSHGIWGRATRSGFSGEEEAGGVRTRVDGEVTGVMLGTDWKRRGTLFGAIVSESRGTGTYDGASSGRIEARLAALVPWAGREAGEGLSFWGAAGIGRGEMTLTPEAGERSVAGLGWRMAAAGAEGALAPGIGGAELDWRADGLWTRTASDAAAGLAASAGTATRLRLGLEAAWERTLASGATLGPRLEAGLRHDGGDAETGFGLEVGGGLGFSDPARGLSLSLDARTLALHEDGSFRNWGLSLGLSWDPRPETKRGWSLSARQGLGDASSGGVDALLGPEVFPGLSGTEGGEGSWSVEAAYGTGRGAGMVGSPYGRADGTGDGGSLRLGYRIEPDADHAADASVDLWARPGTDGEGGEAGAGLEWRW